MTIQIAGYRITLFKLERFSVQIDAEQRKADAEAIKQSAAFQDIKAKAAALRAAR
jgi:hypothetical protein